jgi:predicted transcriptional regulator
MQDTLTALDHPVVSNLPAMVAESLISSRLPSVKPADRAEDVLSWMEDLQVGHLPVVENRELLGLVSEAALRDADDRQLSEAGWMGADGAFVYGRQHAYDVISLMRYTGNGVIPVLDNESQYLGAIGREEVLRYVSDMLAVGEPGGVIVLEMPRANYHLREIASIIESNGARILSLYVSSVPDSERVYVTIKLSQSELTAIMLGFERYGYTVAYTFYDARQLDDSRDRYDALVRYLNV